MLGNHQLYKWMEQGLASWRPILKYKVYISCPNPTTQQPFLFPGESNKNRKYASLLRFPISRLEENVWVGSHPCGLSRLEWGN